MINFDNLVETHSISLNPCVKFGSQHAPTGGGGQLAPKKLVIDSSQFRCNHATNQFKDFEPNLGLVNFVVS